MSTQPIMDGPFVDHPEAVHYHHRWFVVDEKNQHLTRQDVPALESLTLALAHGCLVLRAPGMLRVDIFLDVIEDDESVQAQAHVDSEATSVEGVLNVIDVIDEGDLVAAWFSNFLGRPCRLVKVHPDAAPPAFRPNVIQ